MGILYSVLLAIFFYLAIIIAYKIMGKREISELSIFDFVMNLIIADIVSTGIVEETYWLDSLSGLIVLVTIQVIMAKLQLKIPKLRTQIDAECSVIINNGHIDYEELKKLRIQLDELMMLLRLDNVVNVEDVQYAIMEPNGRLCVFEKRLPTKTFPLPFVISGAVKPYALKSANLQEEWLYRQLEHHKMVINKDIKLILYNEKHLIVHTKTKLKKLKII